MAAEDGKQKKKSFYVAPEALVALVERMQSGDDTAYDEMKKLFREYLVRYFRHKMPETELKEQEDRIEITFDIAYCTIQQLKEPKAFVSWLRSIAHSQIYHYYKEKEIKQRRVEREMKRQEALSARENKRSMSFGLSDSELHRKISELPEVQRQAVELQMKGYKVREIAEIQGVSDGTVKSRLNYARMKIRNSHEQN